MRIYREKREKREKREVEEREEGGLHPKIWDLAWA